MTNKFNSLHIINKRAKIYNQKHTQKAKYRSKALYTLKHKAILQWLNEIENIELHYINNKKYYCFYHQQYSFHIPHEQIQQKIPTTKKRVLHEFQNDTSLAKNTYQTEKQSLETLQQKHNLNPNQYLPNHCSTETYWPYLPM